MISSTAKVRISRFVQKGMVIRNSQKARARGLRVAMNQAVGSPTAKAISVVRIDSFTDRQKIVRCASDQPVTLGSKMSASRKMLYQASVVKCQVTPV